MRMDALKGAGASLLLTLCLAAAPAHAQDNPPLSPMDTPLVSEMPIAVTSTAITARAEHESLVSYIIDTFGQSRALASKIVSAVYNETAKLGVPPLLAMAIIEKESGFQPNAQNPSGATGLMQVIRRFHLDKLRNDPQPQALKNPETNIRVGVAVLNDYLKITGGDVRRALTQYSGGSRSYASEVQSVEGRLSRLVRDKQKKSLVVTRMFDFTSPLPAWCSPVEEEPSQPTP